MDPSYSQSSTPIVTVGLPLYNAERYLHGALNSLLAQDFRQFEIVISDNGSTDATRRICTEYAARDARIRLLLNDVNRGCTWNFNHVAQHARGRYFMWAAHDDLWRSDCLSLYVKALEGDPNAVLVYGREVPIGSQGTQVGKTNSNFANEGTTAIARVRWILEHWEAHSVVLGLFRTDALRRTRMFMPMISSEIILLVEMAVQGKTLEIPEDCFFHRVPDPGTSYRNMDDMQIYLDPSITKRRPFSALAITLESMRFLSTTELIKSPLERTALIYECIRTYLTHRVALDFKTEVLRKLAWHPDLFVQARTAYQALVPRSAPKL
jgi:glycosyltransferase involved in cell wall biosynthesis